MIYGVNVDPNNLPMAPQDLRQMGVQAVRLVSKSDSKTYNYVQSCHWSGIRVLAVVAKESQGYMTPLADVYQIGNEPDAVSPSSWTMTPDEYVGMWNLYRNTYPDFTMIAAGLTSGNVNWWKDVAPRLTGCSAVAVHPYAKTAGQAQQLLWEYHSVRPDIGLWVTEWNRPADQIVPFAHMLYAMTDAAFWFCLSDSMVSGMGLLDTQNHQKAEANMWKITT